MIFDVKHTLFFKLIYKNPEKASKSKRRKKRKKYAAYIKNSTIFSQLKINSTRRITKYYIL
ncbi:MAG: hypothetical protein ACTSPQ_20460 [Candidatus Helarchaeota archaeon]